MPELSVRQIFNDRCQQRLYTVPGGLTRAVWRYRVYQVRKGPVIELSAQCLLVLFSWNICGYRGQPLHRMPIWLLDNCHW